MAKVLLFAVFVLCNFALMLDALPLQSELNSKGQSEHHLIDRVKRQYGMPSRNIVPPIYRSQPAATPYGYGSRVPSNREQIIVNVPNESSRYTPESNPMVIVNVPENSSGYGGYSGSRYG